MTQFSIYERIQRAISMIQGHYAQVSGHFKPEVGIILGSGLGNLSDFVTPQLILKYRDIPFFHGTSVEGHAGEMILGTWSETPVALLKGRFHYYEGYPMEEVVFPTRVLCGLGIQTLILTNAAGGIAPTLVPGDLMLISDHINLMNDNPLKGSHLSELGPRFPDMSEAYSPRLKKVAQLIAQENDIEIKEGVYAGVLGPTYETPAEVRMLRAIGADAVGMSTVPECIAAHHLGVEVLGFSCITNLAAGLSERKVIHPEVLSEASICSEKLRRVLEGALPVITQHCDRKNTLNELIS